MYVVSLLFCFPFVFLTPFIGAKLRDEEERAREDVRVVKEELGPLTFRLAELLARQKRVEAILESVEKRKEGRINQQFDAIEDEVGYSGPLLVSGFSEGLSGPFTPSDEFLSGFQVESIAHAADQPFRVPGPGILSPSQGDQLLQDLGLNSVFPDSGSSSSDAHGQTTQLRDPPL